MNAAPGAEGFEMGREGEAVRGELVTDAGGSRQLFDALDNTLADQVLQMPDQHALGDAGNAAAQFAGAHGLL